MEANSKYKVFSTRLEGAVYTYMYMAGSDLQHCRIKENSYLHDLLLYMKDYPLSKVLCTLPILAVF